MGAASRGPAGAQNRLVRGTPAIHSDMVVTDCVTSASEYSLVELVARFSLDQDQIRGAARRVTRPYRGSSPSPIIYLLPGLSPAERRAALLRARRGADLGYGPPLPVAGVAAAGYGTGSAHPAQRSAGLPRASAAAGSAAGHRGQCHPRVHHDVRGDLYHPAPAGQRPLPQPGPVLAAPPGTSATAPGPWATGAARGASTPPPGQRTHRAGQARPPSEAVAPAGQFTVAHAIRVSDGLPDRAADYGPARRPRRRCRPARRQLPRHPPRAAWISAPSASASSSRGCVSRAPAGLCIPRTCGALYSRSPPGRPL